MFSVYNKTDLNSNSGYLLERFMDEKFRIKKNGNYNLVEVIPEHINSNQLPLKAFLSSNYWICQDYYCHILQWKFGQVPLVSDYTPASF